MEEVIEVKWIAGFWRRIGALLIDAMLLGFVGFLLGLGFESTFVELGSWGKLVGFSIALMYFGFMNSQFFSGQTIGKKILNIKVVNIDNEPIDLARSFLRYAILGIPSSLNGLYFEDNSNIEFLVYPLSFIVFGGLFSIGYLYIFNRVTRQSLHDLVVGSYVVNADAEKVDVGSVWRLHFVIIAIVFIAAGSIPAFMSQVVETEPFKDLLIAREALNESPYLTNAGVTTGSSTVSTTNEGTTTTTFVRVQAILKNDEVNDVEIAKKLALVVIDSYPESKFKDVIQVNLVYGYDIGIWSLWSRHAHNFDPKEISVSDE